MSGNGCPRPRYWNGEEMRSLAELLNAGADMIKEVRDVGGGKLSASVKDADGNAIGLIQPA